MSLPVMRCNFLPAIDNGAQTIEQSLQLARMAVADGITAAVSPHVHLGRYENNRSSLPKKVEAFRKVLAHKQIPIQTFPAGEVRLNSDVLELVATGEAPFLGSFDGYQIMLLEFPHASVPVGADKLVQWLLARKIRPLITHPERNRDIVRAHDKIEPFVRMGCLLQVTSGALLGQFGSGA